MRLRRLGRRPWLRWFAAIFAALAILLVLMVGVLAVGSLSVDAERLRAPIDAALTRALGREVEIAGPARLTLSFHPSLTVHDVRIANPAGFPASALMSAGFGTISELRLDTELLPLLRQQLIVNELRGRGVVVRLARADDGRGNWIFEPEPRPADAKSQSRFRADWRRLVFEEAVIEFALADAPRSVQLDSVVLEGLNGQPQLAVEGTAAGQLRFEGEAGSAPLAELAGQEPWPFTAQLQAPQTVVSVDGARLSIPDGPFLRLQVEIESTNVDEIEALLGVTLPVNGAAAVSGELELAPGLTTLRNLGGHFGGVEVSGEVSADTRGPRPLLSGRLALSEVHITGGADPGYDNKTDSPTLAGLYDVFSETEFHLAQLAQFDADLHLTIGRLVDSPGDVHDVSARVQLAAGSLRVPLTATIGGAAIEAELSAAASTGAPGFGLRFATGDAPFGGLALLLLDLPYVAGTVHRFDADLTSSGHTLAELVHDLEGRVSIEDARLSYGNYKGGRPIALHIGAAQLGQARGQTLAATVRGSLRGKAFEGSFGADTLEHVLSERQTAFHFTGSSAGVQLRLAGLLAEPAADSGPDIEVDLSAPQARELAPWLGFSSQSTDEVALSGRVQVRENGVKLAAGSLQFGRSSIKGDLEWQKIEGKTRVEANLAAELLAPVELRGFRDVPASAHQRTLIDLPILPETLDFGDTDLELTVNAVLGLAVDITDIRFSGRVRNGAIEPSSFSLQLQGNELFGTLELDTRDISPTASMVLEGEAFDTGVLLRRLGLAQDIDAQMSKLRLQASVRGSRLAEVLEQSSFSASFARGTLAYRDAGTESSLNMVIASGELSLEAGGPVTGLITGNAGNVPVRLELDTGPLREFLPPTARWPFAISAAFADAQWEISGATAPGPRPATELTLALRGGRLSELDTLLATALPPWGPYEFTGRLHFAPTSYRVEEARIAIGDSLLMGSGSLDTGAKPATLEASLLAPVIQLDDFALGDWSPLLESESGSESAPDGSVSEPGPEPGSKPPARMTADSARRAFASGVDSVHPMFSRERLSTGNAQVEVSVEKMLSGQDELGQARMAASLINGAATFGPIEINGRFGRGKMVIAYEPREQDAVFSARALVDRLDYGLVLARFVPGLGINGIVSLDLAIDAVTPELNKAMQTASGHIDFAVWPDRLRWSGFDLWATNLMRSLLPFFSPASSHLNCVIGHFDLTEGLLASRALLIDTTNTRALGWARADFVTERLRMRFVPNHKRPRLVSLAIPVEVRGTFSDYRITLRPTDAMGRVAQWFKTLLEVPLHWLGIGRIPSDGRDVCAEPARLQD